MKIFLSISLFLVCGISISQTSGYVLARTDGTVILPNNSISQNQVANLVSDLASKQSTLSSGTSIKTINGASLLGSGDLVVGGGATTWGNIAGTLSNQSDLQTVLNAKANLVSPTFTTPNVGIATATSINGNTFTTGTYTLTGSAGKTLTFNNSITLAGTDGTTITMPAVSATLLPNTTTSNVGTSPTASGTQTITHNLGRTPTIIRIYGIGTFTSNAAATPTPFSIGTFSSSGNRCIYMTTAGTTTQASQSSSTFSVFIATSSGNNISGIIQNVTSTTFDIAWTETGTATAQNYLWEAQ